MDLLHILLLIGAGIIGGIMSAIAGGAAPVTFPALLAVGLSPVVATAVNLTALTASLFLAALHDRAQLPPLDRPFIAMVLVCVLGALIGAVLLLVTPERVFGVADVAKHRPNSHDPCRQPAAAPRTARRCSSKGAGQAG